MRHNRAALVAPKGGAGAPANYGGGMRHNRAALVAPTGVRALPRITEAV